ncbi:hypothetical protein B0J14DRAFT_705203 [Halenospora varia]|nr:hypothetical protein B0J14DRAFT_705203 [Halenospora varia]
MPATKRSAAAALAPREPQQPPKKKAKAAPKKKGRAKETKSKAKNAIKAVVEVPTEPSPLPAEIKLMIFQNLDAITATSWMVADEAMYKSTKVRSAFLKIYTHPDLLLQQSSDDEGELGDDERPDEGREPERDGEPSNNEESNGDKKSEDWKEVRIKFPPPEFSFFDKDGTHYMMKASIRSWIPEHLAWDFYDQKWKGPEGTEEALERLKDSIRNEKYRVGVELEDKLKQRGADKRARQEARKTRIEQKKDARELRHQEFLAENPDAELYKSEDESDGDGDSYTSSDLPGSDIEKGDDLGPMYKWVNSELVSDSE